MSYTLTYAEKKEKFDEVVEQDGATMQFRLLLTISSMHIVLLPQPFKPIITSLSHCVASPEAGLSLQWWAMRATITAWCRTFRNSHFSTISELELPSPGQVSFIGTSQSSQRFLESMV